MTIRITKGTYTGRTFRVRDTDGWRVQVVIGRSIEEFKLGFDCVVVR